MTVSLRSALPSPHTSFISGWGHSFITLPDRSPSGPCPRGIKARVSSLVSPPLESIVEADLEEAGLSHKLLLASENLARPTLGGRPPLSESSLLKPDPLACYLKRPLRPSGETRFILSECPSPHYGSFPPVKSKHGPERGSIYFFPGY